MDRIKLNQTGLSIPIKVVKVGEAPYDGDGWDKSKPYYLVDGADGTVLCGVTESLKKAFEYMAQCTNESHAPVIDAEKLADSIAVMSRQKIHQSNVLLFKNNISALITSSIDKE